MCFALRRESNGGSLQEIVRLAMLISGTPDYEQGKLFGVPEIVDSAGFSQATATSSLVKQLDLADNIVGLSFETTASNSGWQNGACLKIEILLLLNSTFQAAVHSLESAI